MFREISFDIDNTLYSTDVEVKAYNEVVNFLTNETPLINATITTIIEAKEKAKLRVPNTRNRLFYFKELSLTLSQVKKCYSIYWTTFLKNMNLAKGTSEFLNLLKSKNVKLNCVTDFTLKEQLEKLDVLNVLDYFDNIITSEEKACEKPCLSMFLSTKDGLLIGDDYKKDILGAKNAGWSSIHIDSSQKFTVSQNHLVFQSMNDINDFFSGYFMAIEKVVYLSKKVGERIDLIQAGGGNISCKFSFKGQRFMVIKSSGICLADVNFFNGHTLVCEKGNVIFGTKPSIETSMHWACDKDIVIHCHPKEIVVESLDSNFLLPYIEPGEELAKAIKNFKSKQIITLTNHGIIFQYNHSENLSIQTLDNFLLSESKYTKCNELSDKFGGLVKISQHSDQFIKLKSQYGNLCHKTFFPDFAVYCNNLIYESDAVYIKGESLRQIYQIDEVFALHVSCCESLKNNLNPKTIDQDKISKRDDEKYRFELSK